MSIADAHVHLFRGGFEGAFDLPPAGTDEVAAYEGIRARFGIEQALVIAYEGASRYAGNSEHVLALSKRHPWIAPTWYLPVRPAPRPEQLEALGARGVVGYSIYLERREDGLDLAQWPAPVFEELVEQRAIVSINAVLDATAAIAGAVDALLGCPVLFSHLGCPPSFSEPPSLPDARDHLEPLLRLASRPQVGVKLSALYAVSDPHHDFPHRAAMPFVDLVLDVFGSERLYWGSDFSPALDFVSFAQAVEPRLLAGCSSDDVARVMGGNLLGLLADRGPAHVVGEEME